MIRIATIGTSAITRNLIDAIASTPGAVFAGTLSRDAARAEAFTAEPAMIRIATIGTSAITRNLIDAIASTPGAVFAGTLSRDAARAEAFTAEHGGTHPFTSLEELAGSDQVDAVYIGSPNALHHDQALACIAGNKHVLVEKPFCANAREAHQVFSAAERAGVVALEAMRPLHDPAFHKVKGLLGELGPIRRATLRFGK